MSSRWEIKGPEAEKPCQELGYCPYGSEYFPVAEPGEERGCKAFGHVRPVYFVGEDASEKNER
ncbi:hypothetical protein AKJ40_00855 [candidate division MSBL1 archaeon SCGC-AAA259M10]|uniref:Uncharacterized protein n=1 Tax=candidate division MSBL1 archaeon SCGC-AAA259M10 TaxID=1698270 RepID=A0A133V2L0_9EURY|nr:hypothetical protein AKJ40_00855 [candidate division MSBL1 archaeon SCGC-AAA259M10]